MSAFPVTHLNIFPVKSIAPISLSGANVVKTGLEHDRLFALANESGRVVTAREFPQLLHVESSVEENGILVSANEKSVIIPFGVGQAAASDLQLFKEQITGVSVGEDLDQFFSDYLGEKVRLMGVNNENPRAILERRGGKPGDQVGFADAQPVLLTTSASLADLNDQLAEKIGMDRFRSNIVIDNKVPFQELNWKQVQIGEVLFDVAQPCGRCVLTTVDTKSLQKHKSGQPLGVLNSYDHNPKGKTVFGVYLIPRKTGRITVGDSLKVMA